MARKGLIRHQNPEYPDIRDYVESLKGEEGRPTAQNLADAIKMSLGRAQTLIKEGWTAGDLLMISEALELNPVIVLYDYEFIDHKAIQEARAHMVRPDPDEAYTHVTRRMRELVFKDMLERLESEDEG
ncbi:hypothetical protein HMPREF2736_00205 [Corynebacterium sp. HMSC036E10]|uniref:Uncharacterized protein n=1 Tax=Corynebacterium coyleae TaxID=53374 RepID=A0AAP6XLF5_9CORY|nr:MULTISPECIES: hypothetical protein [Corynebacterium]NJJ04559.1 hypothetical protein [Corynebacterium coyleae]OHO77687.1 hypothetical protein HMPREF2736_00205 [Corynebacterium sp. HMSC036E10]